MVLNLKNQEEYKNMKNVQKYKVCRRLGSGVYEKCQTPKFVASETRHSKASRNKKAKPLSGYGQQLVEKQKVRFMYGISETQFVNYVKKAIVTKGKPSAESLFELLENRLDNVVYRLGLANSRRLSRQMVSHGHITVNGKKINIPSHSLKEGDVVAVREGSKKSVLFTDMAVKLKDYNSPNWLAFNIDSLSGKVQGAPKNIEGFVDLNSVLEFYSR
jgi:small subunit ribosomal protein S4